MPALDLVVPGDPATRTGGYIYDRRILEALAARGWQTRVHRLDASFPRPTAAAVADAAKTLADIPAGRAVVVDGLALPGLDVALAAEAPRLRIVALVHHPVALETGLPPAERETIAAAEAAAIGHAAGVIVTSRWTARTLAGAGVPAERIRVVEPGTDPAPPRLPRFGTPWRLLCVGTLTPRKRHALLVEALAPLRDRSWVLDCVGSTARDPAAAAALRGLIERHGLEGRVHLRGELDPAAVAEYYRGADAFVLASDLEGYGMALAEAVAHGLPIVSTTAGAIPDTVPAAGSLLVPPGDGAALSAALARLFDEPGLRRRLEDGSRAARSLLPTWQEAAARFAAAIDELAA
ncbi:MAG TPA: glycosyltransferase family 4 protein [Gammaproteobacteria bacterium]|nr:glycosyltransferase family 4 protein [Gammaproteobacteria bacterium]